jgi:hypothetical protein
MAQGLSAWVRELEESDSFTVNGPPISVLVRGSLRLETHATRRAFSAASESGRRYMGQAIVILSLLGLVGCGDTYSPTQRAVGGGLLGGAGGAAIGGLAAGGKGALIGGGLGAAGGAVAGAATTPQPTYRSYSSGGGGYYY